MHLRNAKFWQGRVEFTGTQREDTPPLSNSSIQLFSIRSEVVLIQKALSAGQGEVGHLLLANIFAKQKPTATEH